MNPLDSWLRPNEIEKSRSSALTPLQWGSAIILGAMVTAAGVKAPSRMSMGLAIAAAANFVQYPLIERHMFLI
jgi:hypothetical protein